MKIAWCVFALLCSLSAVAYSQMGPKNQQKEVNGAYSSAPVIEFRPQRFQVHDLRALGNVQLSVLVDTKTGCSWVFGVTSSGFIWKFVPIEDGSNDAKSQESLCLGSRITAIAQANKEKTQ